MRRSFAFLCCALGCATPLPDGTVERHADAIIDGEPSGSEEDGVVMLHALLEDDTEVLCSASLVAPNLVLTARHCVSYLMPGLFSCTVRGELIDNPDGGGSLGAHLPAESIEVYGHTAPREAPLARGQKIISTLAPAICINDLAFVVLDTSLDLPVIPMRIGGPALVGEQGSLVGFGLVRDQKVLDYRLQPRARKADLEIAELGPDLLEDGVTTAPPRSLILRGPSGCVGDSGGPFLAASTGAVLGVYSLQAGELCEAEHVHHQLVHVPPFQALIDEAFAAADAIPTPEQQPAAGEGGAGGGISEAPAAGANSAGTEPTEPAPNGGGETGCTFAAASGSPRRASWMLAALALTALRRKRSRA